MKAIVFAAAALALSLAAHAESESEALDACLSAWNQHPFGGAPVYKTLDGSVTVLGRGPATSDREVTATPSLILVNPGVNVLGGARVELLNPNGWYCLRSAVTVMGGLDIQLHCRAHMASAGGRTTTVWGGAAVTPGVTVMGSVKVERIGCPSN